MAKQPVNLVNSGKEVCSVGGESNWERNIHQINFTNIATQLQLLFDWTNLKI